jgi:hypothetical protein
LCVCFLQWGKKEWLHTLWTVVWCEEQIFVQGTDLFTAIVKGWD